MLGTLRAMRMAPLFPCLFLFTFAAASARSEQDSGSAAGSRDGGAKPKAPSADPGISAAHRKLLRRLLAEAGAENADLAVVERAPEQQTRIMYDAARENQQRARDTYCDAGDRVIDRFDPKLSEAENLSRMQEELVRQLPRARELGCLNHVRNDDVYAVDVAVDQVPHPDTLIDAATKAAKAGRIERFLGPPRHPGAFHFEFKRRSDPQDGSKRAAPGESR